jgi:predicted Zn-dependent protease
MQYIRLLVLVLLASILTGCIQNPSTGRRQLILFSQQEVTAMGIEAKPQVIQEFGGEVESQALRTYVSDIGQRLVQHVLPEYRDLPWEFITLDSEVVNAFALPGGKIFVTRGLLSRFENEAQLAGVLGHEIGHVTARHVDERLSQAAVAELGLSVLGDYAESELINYGAGLATQGVMLKFSRDHEDESDMQGVKYMVAEGYDPMAMIGVLEVLKQASRDGRPPEFLSTHPYPESRIEDIERLIQQRYAYTRDNAQYRLYSDRFQREALRYLSGDR